MDRRAWAADNLAAKLLAGPWTAQDIGAGIVAVVGPVRLRVLRALAHRLHALSDGTYPPTHADLTAWLVHERLFRLPKNRPVATVFDAPRFAPLPPFADLPIPALATLGDLADWLGLSAEHLDWLADERRGHFRATDSPLHHYRYAIVPKRDGKVRLIEAPKPRLKAIQRHILREILSAVPVHPCAHGFVRGRSCLTGAHIHAGEAMVATFDLAQFFPSIGLPRIHGLFRALGYPWPVARRLAGLCTTITPAAICRRVDTVYSAPHLPQGAPTSPAIANLLAWRLDLRLRGLARAADAAYSRYADDIAFSGDDGFAKRLAGFGKTVATIAQEEGFSLNPAKTRIMPRSGQQRVTGIVVNAHCNTQRAEFDALKAMLHNCTRTGPAAQNHANVPDFRRHLDGRIAWAEQINQARGLKLRRVFERIDWGG